MKPLIMILADSAYIEAYKYAPIAIMAVVLSNFSGLIGGVFAALGDAVGLNIYFQLALFALFSTLSIFFVRPVALRYLHRGEEHRVSNADALLGRKGRVVEAIEANGFGRVQIDGDIWKAKNNDGQPIAEGESVTVTDRASTIITVKK